jgi:protein tyrosine phosphatase (PTP) superfamily phosphohydrolase (DUF442 family)
MSRLRLGSVAGLILALLGTADADAVDRCRAEPDAVVLLHGLGRSPRSMAKLGEALSEDGYEVFNLGYPSRQRPIEQLALDIDAALSVCCRGRDRYTHFVTHSLGGIVLRYYLKSAPLDNIGRVVMLSPPNSGSELVDLLRKLPYLGDHPGAARGQLGTRADDLPTVLGAVDFEVGVVAGNRGVVPPLSWIIPGEDDGVVAVERTRVDRMSDFVVLPHAHSFIMRSDEVIEQTRAFLASGRFAPVDLPGFARVDDGLYRGAQPGEAGVGELVRLGIRTILDLRSEGAAVEEERARAEAAGLRHLHVPLPSGGKPDPAVVGQVMGLLNDAAHRPLFVHCRRGADRTGMIIACYRILTQGWTPQQAMDEARAMGLGWWQLGMKSYIETACREGPRASARDDVDAQSPTTAPSTWANGIGSPWRADGSVKTGAPVAASQAIFSRSPRTQQR